MRTVSASASSWQRDRQAFDDLAKLRELFYAAKTDHEANDLAEAINDVQRKLKLRPTRFHGVARES